MLLREIIFVVVVKDLHLTKFRWLTQIIDFIIDSSTLLDRARLEVV